MLQVGADLIAPGAFFFEGGSLDFRRMHFNLESQDGAGAEAEGHIKFRFSYSLLKFILNIAPWRMDGSNMCNGGSNEQRPLAPPSHSSIDIHYEKQCTLFFHSG